MVQTFTEQQQGFSLHGLRNESVEIVVIPELGAKISSLRNRHSGREWMWTPPDRGGLFRNRTGDAFEDSTIIGADECIPTIAPCRWRGHDLPDHGEAWSAAWSLDAEAFAAGTITTRLRLPLSPLQMARAVSVQGSTVQIAYAVTNMGDTPYEYIWALHPLLAFAEEDRILLPARVRSVRTDSAANLPWEGRGVELAWPQPGHDVALDRLDLGRPNSSIKLFTDPLTEGRAALRNQRSGDYLVFTFDTAITNTLGIWINRGAWHGYHHVALEPGNGAPDLLSLAVEDWGRFARLQPGETHRWSLALHLGVDTQTETERFLDQFSSESTIQ